MSRADWKDYKWRLVHAEPQTPALHMALDEVLTDEVAARHRPPTLRAWEWSLPCVVIGRFQSLRNEVDVLAAHRHGIHVVRRISGGGAMFVEPGNSITFSLYAPETLVSGMGFQEAYEFMDAWVIHALQGLGINAWYQPLNEIASPAGRIAEAAQTRRSGAVLHHVTLAYDIDAAKMLGVLRAGRGKHMDGAGCTPADRVDPLRSQTGLARAEIIDRMIATFRGLHGLAPGKLEPREIELASMLAASKFSSAAWTGIVP